jgi:hypothetical protein
VLYAVTANAQIVYTNIKPDSTIFFSSGNFHLDLNNDGAIDYILRFGYSFSCTRKESKWNSLGSTSSGKQVLCVTGMPSPAGSNYPKKLLANDVIDGSSQLWSGGGTLRGELWTCSGIRNDIGNWKTIKDGYVGLRLNDGVNTYYGWVRLSVSGTNSITIKDYAYNKTPNQPIRAGRTSSVVASTNMVANQQLNNEKVISKTIRLNVVPNPLSNSTTISFTLSHLQKVFIGIYDMTGRLIKTLANSELQQGTHQLVWNAKDEGGNAVVSGMYILKMQAGSYLETKKLIVAK